MITNFLTPQIDPAQPERIPEAIAARLGPYRDVFTKIVGLTLSSGGIDAMVLGGSRSPLMPQRYLFDNSDLDLSWVTVDKEAQARLEAGLKDIISFDPKWPDYFGGEPYPYWWLGDNKELEVGVKIFNRGQLLGSARDAYLDREHYEASSGFLAHRVQEGVPLLMNTNELLDAKQVADNMPPEFRRALLGTYMNLLDLQITGARPWFKNQLEYLSDQGPILQNISRIQHLLNKMHYMPGNKQWDLDSILMAPDIVAEIHTLMNFGSNWGENGRPLRQAISSINEKFKTYVPQVLGEV
jgi:hypothetical protein